METPLEEGITRKPGWPIILGPLVFLISFFLPSPDSFYPLIPVMIGLTIWIALWWLTEAVHIAVTSFIPFIFIPACGIADIKVVSAQYMDPILFLFLGGFLLSFAIEKWGLHRRLALFILSSTGHSAGNILIGVMLTAFIISMWISNTATVMMLISAVLAVIYQLNHHLKNKEHHRVIGSALLIGLAYSANIGGMSTLVGTPTNMIFYRSYSEHFGTTYPITFTGWMAFALPVALLLLITTWLVLRFTLLKKLAAIPFDKEVFKAQRKQLGNWNKDERLTFLVFLLTVILWFTRANFELGSVTLRGWSSYFPYPTQITDGTVAMFMALLLFVIPSSTEKGRSLLTWTEASKIPYEIILLFGSGFALAKGFESSGLSNWLAQQLHALKGVHPFLIIVTIGIIVTLISEFASNVASIQLVMPVLISLQAVVGQHPALLLVTAALAASLGFMLPVATAPNTIVFSSGHIKVREMAMAGLIIDLAGILIISIYLYCFF
jgi:solute carrier family 13 (sodium-dependent dicarboxylate transporter), member 2/3/5